MEAIMISIFTGNNRKNYPVIADAMFRQRKRHFHDRLGWDVEITDGWEIDKYDDFNPVYLVSIDETTGVVRGSLRLLPTTGANMMRDIFSEMFDGDTLIESAAVWECTRFCVDTDNREIQLADNGLAYATCELLQGICEVGLLAGATLITGVFDRHMTRIYKRAAWSPDIIGTSKNTAKRETIHVGLWDVSQTVLAEMRESSGLPENVLESQTKVAYTLNTVTAFESFAQA
jgi:acyl homoserine lactone synthase